MTLNCFMLIFILSNVSVLKNSKVNNINNFTVWCMLNNDGLNNLF